MPGLRVLEFCWTILHHPYCNRNNYTACAFNTPDYPTPTEPLSSAPQFFSGLCGRCINLLFNYFITYSHKVLQCGIRKTLMCLTENGTIRYRQQKWQGWLSISGVILYYVSLIKWTGSCFYAKNEPKCLKMFTVLSHVWPHNPETGFRPPSATVVSAEPFLHRTGTLRCLQKEMATYRHWSVSLRRDPDDVSHCRILSPDKTKLNGGLSRLHSADEDAVSWVTSYSSWQAYEKKKKIQEYCTKNNFIKWLSFKTK